LTKKVCVSLFKPRGTFKVLHILIIETIASFGFLYSRDMCNQKQLIQSLKNCLF